MNNNNNEVIVGTIIAMLDDMPEIDRMGIISFLLYKYSTESKDADEYIDIILDTIKQTREHFKK